MAKFSGKLGIVTDYQESVDEPGVYNPVYEVVNVAGDVLHQYQKNDAGEKINDDISFSHRFSFLASQRILSMITGAKTDVNGITLAYLEYYGIKLKITNIEISMPRIIITVGGRYNV